MKRKKKQQMVKIISIIVLLIGAVIMLVPFFWMISTSLKNVADVFKYPPTFFGSEIKWSNYASVFQATDFLGMLKNTVIVTAVVAVGQLLTSAMAGFAFSYLNFRGREVIFKVFLFAVMIPFHVSDSNFCYYERSETAKFVVGIDLAVYCITVGGVYDEAKLHVSSQIIR